MTLMDWPGRQRRFLVDSIADMMIESDKEQVTKTPNQPLLTGDHSRTVKCHFKQVAVTLATEAAINYAQRNNLTLDYYREFDIDIHKLIVSAIKRDRVIDYLRQRDDKISA